MLVLVMTELCMTTAALCHFVLYWTCSLENQGWAVFVFAMGHWKMSVTLRRSLFRLFIALRTVMVPWMLDWLKGSPKAAVVCRWIHWLSGDINCLSNFKVYILVKKFFFALISVVKFSNFSVIPSASCASATSSDWSSAFCNFGFQMSSFEASAEESCH